MTILLTYLLFSANLLGFDQNLKIDWQIFPPVEKKISRQIVISAKSAIVIEENSGMVVFEKNADQTLPIGSLTKIMTALVFLEKFPNFQNLSISVSKKATEVGGSKMYLLQGEQITAINLLRGLFIGSANDAAFALAIFTSQEIEKFVEEMNRRSHFFGLQKTSFQNPAGFDDPKNFSTAREISFIARKIWQFDFIREIAKTKKITIFDNSKKFSHQIWATNFLLGKYGVIGLKTGTTDEAGQCFVAVCETKNETFFIVILGSEDRFLDAKTIIWAIENR